MTLDTAQTGDCAHFTRWRPKIHLMPPRGWANDPCAPAYDPTRERYHLAFQWNPDSWDWGRISWACATSKDLINWTVSPRPSIEPSRDTDPGGIFSGCMLPPDLAGTEDGSLTCFYTSVQRIPVHYNLPYTYGNERLHLAESKDGGQTWQRHTGNPLLAGPPEKVAVAGWRDPFVFSNKSLDHILGKDSRAGTYGIVAGGIKGKTPTIFLYSLDSDDITKWTFISSMIRFGHNFAPYRRWGDFGMNWEMTNIMTLYDERRQPFDIVVASVEGCIVTSEDKIVLDQPVNRARRTGRGQMWFHGEVLAGRNTPIGIRYVSGGHLDYGAFYAASSFFDPVSQTQIVYGWVLEEDLPDKLREQQGWSGLIAFPRKLTMITIENVEYSSIESLVDVPGFTSKLDDRGTWAVTTLSITPEPRTKLLRRRETQSDRSLKTTTSLATEPSIWFSEGVPHFELQASLSVSSSTTELGLHLFHSPDRSQHTTILHNVLHDLVLIQRDHSSDSSLGIKTHTEVAPHVLLSTRSDTGELERETLDIRLFYDVSVLEVFVNNRVVITTRVYPDSGTCFGIECFGTAAAERFAVWPLELDSGYTENAVAKT